MYNKGAASTREAFIAISVNIDTWGMSGDMIKEMSEKDRRGEG